MRRVLSVVVIIALISGLAVNGQAPPSKLKLLPDRNEKLIDEVKDANKSLAQDLRDAQVLVTAVSDANLRSRINETLTKAEKNAERLQKAVVELGGAGFIPNATKEEFDRLVTSLRAEAFDNKRLTILRDAVKHKGVSCQQAKQIVSVFSFGDGQREAAITLYPRLTDPMNFQDVLRVFTFESDRQEVRKRLGIK